MQDINAAEILHKYKEGNCSEEEKLLLKKWFLTFEGEPSAHFSELELKRAEAEMWTEIQSHIPFAAYQTLPEINSKLSSPPPYFKIWRWKAYAAAAVLLLAGITIYLNIKPQKPASGNYVILHTKDLKPGSDRAILVYGNGKQRILSGKVYKIADIAESNTQPVEEFNTIITPKGGQYEVVLPDGTAVWLNAASSLKYPITFAGQKQRRVILTGEAYFEVAHNKAKPFKVITIKQEIEVLGTHFNVNSYTDEAFTATTLVSGSVKISSRIGFKIMKPGQQALVSGSGLMPKIIETDPEQSLAWKNGFFQFKRADLKTVMRQLSRWYDVDIDYQGEVPQKIFTGKIYRNLKLSEALEVLSYFNVHFSLEGQKLTITN